MKKLSSENPQFKDKTGEKFTTNEGYKVEITEYYRYNNCTILFPNGNTLENIPVYNLKTGKVKNPFHPSVYGVGYLGGKNIGNTEASGQWYGMISRCYSNIYNTYKDVNVCKEWHNFQNFAEWFNKNYKNKYMSGWDLDKDILIKGNKIYSPKTCCLVPTEINNLFIRRESMRNGLPIGVVKHRKAYKAQINGKYISTCETPEEAFQAYKITKELKIKELADKWKPFITLEVYQAMYKYQVEITD